MNTREISRLNNPQLLALRSSDAFESDREKIREVLLVRNGLDAAIFEQLHTSSNCETRSEYVHFIHSGLWDVDLIAEERLNIFVRVCPQHGVESAEFGVLGSAPDDWDGVKKPRRLRNEENN